MTIAVTGSTGHLGRLIVDHLLARGTAPGDIVALGRNEARLAELEGLGVRTARADYADVDGLSRALEGVDTVMLVSGDAVGQRVQQHGNVIDAAVGAGARRIVYTSAPRATDTTLVLAPEHKATEERLAASGLAVTVLRNNWYTENYTATVERARESGVVSSSVGDGRVASAPRGDYAEAAAVVLTEDGHEGAVYELSGDEAWSSAELAAAASEVLGRPVEYRALTPEEHLRTLLDAGLDEGTAGFVVALDGNIRDGLLGETSGDLSRLIGRPTVPLARALAEDLS
ncbi:NAD(P)H dehydrogenase (quinone) [Diaminobutyricimonas aerilata]|uniref:NAD(P)H dehydrogenase (Quinone) n=1 Tax=Diaminobutyricimonas aerilata TaxID=1162967 RepID=A0A2M9CIQ4_9MICO|nr:SDR family oxidoreductase [Diaminobutyricimonas aerilata]PJJ71813.1 NAD(P)H dehydrogenase (quinone) [Diaminobutyricimonas aerilata]